MKAVKRHYWEKLANKKKIQKSLEELQNIVNNSDGITGITLSFDDSEVEFKKEEKSNE